MKLIFPENDSRSNGQSFNEKRPWLKQGAECEHFPITSRQYRYTAAVQFEGAPKNNYDLVSWEFLKTK